MSFSNDDSKILSASSDGYIKIWDTQTFELLRSFASTSSIDCGPTFLDQDKFILANIKGKTIIQEASVSYRSLNKSWAIKDWNRHLICNPCIETQIATCNIDNMVEVWDTKEKKIINSLSIKGSGMQGFAYSPNGTEIAIVSDSMIVKLQTVDNLDSVSIIQHNSLLNSVSYSSDGKYICSIGNNNSICLWDAIKNTLIRQIPINLNNNSYCEFHPFENKVLVELSKTEIGSIDLTCGNITKYINDNNYKISNPKYSPNGEFIAAICNDDSTIVIWDIYTHKIINKLKGHNGSLYNFNFNSSADMIASSSFDGTVRIWGIKQSYPICFFKNEFVRNVDWSKNDNIVSAGMYNIKIWDSRTIKEKDVNLLNLHSNTVYTLNCINNGTMAISGSYDKTIRFWDTNSRKEVLNIKEKHNVRNLSYNSMKKILAVAGDGHLSVWDLEKNKRKISLFCGYNSIESVVVFSNGTQMIAGGRDKKIRIWKTLNINDCQIIDVGKEVYNLCLSSDEKLLALACDGCVKIYGTETFQLVKEIKTDTETNWSVIFCKNNEKIVVSSSDKIIRSFYVASGEYDKSYYGHTSQVRGCAISEDGAKLVSASSDQSIIVWDFESGSIIKKIDKAHDTGIFSVSFCNGDKQIISGASDGTIKVWDFPDLQYLIAKTKSELSGRLLGKYDYYKYIEMK